ncbi:MAG: type III-B CRISPR module-associated protein Cmr3 [Methanotrichaceae archaeon]
MKLFIEPIDVWLFRDGRPFDAGSDHRAQSLFPPYPTVMQGILRSHHLVVREIDLTDQQAIAKAVGTATQYPRGFRVRGPFLARRTSEGIVRYFPLPADAVQDDNVFRALVPREPPEGVWSSVIAQMLLWHEDEPVKIKDQWWLREDALQTYLEQGEVASDKQAQQEGLVCSGGTLFQRENRPGIGLDDATRTTRKGALYEVEFVRPCSDVGLEVEVEGMDGWKAAGFMRAGGEGHGARYELSGASAWPFPPDPLPPRFKVYLATPAYFKAGWQAADWSHFFDDQVELVAAAVGRYQVLGGFDLATSSHKTARRYVPAGSVYFFKCKGQAAIKADLVNRAVTDEGAEIGFGQVIIGKW